MRTGTTPLPYLEGKYDLLSIDTATRYQHPGLLGAECVVWDDGASYRISYPTFTFPFPTTEDVSWSELYSGLQWLHSKGRALRHITKEMLFASRISSPEDVSEEKKGVMKIKAQIYVGEEVVIATPETCRSNFEMLRSYVPLHEDYLRELSSREKLEGESEEDSGEESGEERCNYDSFFEEADLDHYPGRDVLKLFIDLLFRQYASWSVEDIFRVIDIYQRLLMFSEESPLTLQKIALECVERTFHGKKHEETVRRHVLERHLLLNFHGVFYSPLQGQLQRASDVKYLIIYYALNFDPTTYFLATRVAGKGSKEILHMTLSDALSTR